MSQLRPVGSLEASAKSDDKVLGVGPGTVSGSAPTGRAAMLMVRFPRRANHGVLTTFLYGLKYHFWRLCEQKLLFSRGRVSCRHQLKK